MAPIIDEQEFVLLHRWPCHESSRGVCFPQREGGSACPVVRVLAIHRHLRRVLDREKHLLLLFIDGIGVAPVGNLQITRGFDITSGVMGKCDQMIFIRCYGS